MGWIPRVSRFESPMSTKSSNVGHYVNSNSFYTGCAECEEETPVTRRIVLTASIRVCSQSFPADILAPDCRTLEDVIGQ